MCRKRRALTPSAFRRSSRICVSRSSTSAACAAFSFSRASRSAASAALSFSRASLSALSCLAASSAAASRSSSSFRSLSISCRERTAARGQKHHT